MNDVISYCNIMSGLEATLSMWLSITVLSKTVRIYCLWFCRLISIEFKIVMVQNWNYEENSTCRVQKYQLQISLSWGLCQFFWCSKQHQHGQGIHLCGSSHFTGNGQKYGCPVTVNVEPLHLHVLGGPLLHGGIDYNTPLRQWRVETTSGVFG